MARIPQIQFPSFRRHLVRSKIITSRRSIFSRDQVDGLIPLFWLLEPSWVFGYLLYGHPFLDSLGGRSTGGHSDGPNL